MFENEIIVLDADDGDGDGDGDDEKINFNNYKPDFLTQPFDWFCVWFGWCDLMSLTHTQANQTSQHQKWNIPPVIHTYTYNPFFCLTLWVPGILFLGSDRIESASLTMALTDWLTEMCVFGVFFYSVFLQI